MSKIEFLPCPFCGSENVGLHRECICGGHGIYYDVLYVRCNDCHCQGPFVDTYNSSSINLEESAISKWQDRK